MKHELLAPVGGWPHLIAAVSNGADAVYMGGMFFNARIFADNFTEDDLPEAINYAHLHDVKVYITLNTLIRDDELEKAFKYAKHLYEIGADALIIQDMGLARLVHKYLPNFEMHLSTQGTVYNTHAIDTVKEIGFDRIVPARELSMEEIKKFTSACHEQNIETEVFVHGALCMCYSGQCQLSRGLNAQTEGGRSGNRGTCAQPCRQAYIDDKGNKAYLLSPKDLCYIESLPKLIEAGIESFKIEGRIKSPEYVAIVTRIYRKYIDKYLELRKNNDAEVAAEAYRVNEQDIKMLLQAFNRGGFSEGYLYGNPGQDLLSGTSPKNQGVYLGKVIAIIDNEYKVESHEDKLAVRGALRRGRNLVCIELTSGELNIGDGVEFRNDTPDYESNPIGNVTTYISKLEKNLYLIGDFDKGIEIGDKVYKVTDTKLQQEALSMPEKKLPVTMSFTARIGQYLSLVMTDVKSGFSAELISDHIVEKAIKSPTDKERIISQLVRLGDTSYQADWTSIDIELDEKAMVPVSLINRMRRDLADQLMEARIRRPQPVKVESIPELDNLIGETKARKIKSNLGKPIPLQEFISHPEKRDGAIPYIQNVSKGNLDKYIEENFDEIVKAVKQTGILIGNLGWIKEFQDAGVKVYGDYGLNVYNSQAEELFADLGVEMYEYSHETGVSDERGLPLMITEHPIESEYLIDRKGAKHNVKCSESGDKWLIY